MNLAGIGVAFCIWRASRLTRRASLWTSRAERLSGRAPALEPRKPRLVVCPACAGLLALADDGGCRVMLATGCSLPACPASRVEA